MASIGELRLIPVVSQFVGGSRKAGIGEYARKLVELDECHAIAPSICNSAPTVLFKILGELGVRHLVENVVSARFDKTGEQLVEVLLDEIAK